MSRRCAAGRTPARCAPSARRAAIAASPRATCARSCSARSRQPQYTDVGDIATKRIRRQLTRGHADWYEHVDAAQREKLRPLGRRLMGLVAAYVAKRGRKSSLLEEARATGAEYGAGARRVAHLADAGDARLHVLPPQPRRVGEAGAREDRHAAGARRRGLRADHGAGRRSAAWHRERIRPGSAVDRPLARDNGQRRHVVARSRAGTSKSPCRHPESSAERSAEQRTSGRIGAWRLFDIFAASLTWRGAMLGGGSLLPRRGRATHRRRRRSRREELPDSYLSDSEQQQAVQRERARRFVRDAAAGAHVGVRMALYPIFVETSGRRVIVIGGGHVGAEKVRGLLAGEADITVVSPELIPELQEHKDAGRIRHVARAYREADLDDGYEFIMVATDDGAINAEVAAAGKRRGIWVNAADDPKNCDFILPVRRAQGKDHARRIDVRHEPRAGAAAARGARRVPDRRHAGAGGPARRSAAGDARARHQGRERHAGSRRSTGSCACCCTAEATGRRGRV